jgi:PAS domain S-box-containing protein
MGVVTMESLKLALDATQDVVVITEADRREQGPGQSPGHTILYVNPAFERMTGYSQQEALGKTCAMLQGPKTDPAERARMRAAFDSWSSVRSELINYRKDGSEFAVELQIDPLVDRDGWYTHWISVQRDVTERRANEEAKRRSEERIRLGVQVARLGLADIDYTTGMVILSPQAAHLFGFGERELTISRQRLHETFHPDDAPDVRAKIAAALDPSGLGWFETDHRVVWPSGEVRWLRVSKQVRFDGEAGARRPVWGTLAAFDVTVLKRAEADLRESQRQFRELAGGVAHDFNNLLTAVAGHTSMLQAAGLGSAAMVHTAAIQEAARSASELTQQLLDLSGRHVLPPEVLSVNDCIQRSVQVSRANLRPGIVIETVLDPGAGKVRMNRTQLNQILLNLLMNAQDAITGDGVVTISTSQVVRATEHDPNQPYRSLVEILVADSGSGIALDVLEHVFEPYFSTKLRTDGPTRGLGLAIVRAIVNEAGGSITVENAVGSGARFSVLLPRLRDQAVPLKPTAPAVAASVSQGKTVLLAEDDKRVRELVHQALSAQGFHVLAAEDGQAALDLAQKLSIDLLITDVRMPRLDGVSLAQAVAKQKPGVPTLLMSGFLASVQQGSEDLDAGWLFLQKPFSLEAFSAKVAELGRIAAAEIPCHA